MGDNPNIPHFWVGYNPFTSHLPTSWDMQVGFKQTLSVVYPWSSSSLYIWNLWLPVANISGKDRPLVPKCSKYRELEDEGEIKISRHCQCNNESYIQWITSPFYQIKSSWKIRSQQQITPESIYRWPKKKHQNSPEKKNRSHLKTKKHRFPKQTPPPKKNWDRNVLSSHPSATRHGATIYEARHLRVGWIQSREGNVEDVVGWRPRRSVFFWWKNGWMEQSRRLW